jgi:hypothetical protein
MASATRTVTVTVESPGLDDTLAKLERVKALADEIKAMGFGPTAVTMPTDGLSGAILDGVTQDVTDDIDGTVEAAPDVEVATPDTSPSATA